MFRGRSSQRGRCRLLAQGAHSTRMLSGVSFHGGPSVTIKSHHNVGGLPERMNMRLVEPLRELFKDEVRELGQELGLSDRFVGRHPFPGPGLAIRIPGAITGEKLDVLRRARRHFILRKSAKPVCMKRFGRPLPYYCPYRQSGSWAARPRL